MRRNWPYSLSTKLFLAFALVALLGIGTVAIVAYQVTAPSDGDGQLVPALVEQAQNNLPPSRIKTLAYDMAADSNAVHQCLHAAGIQPVIENRCLWKEELERPIPVQSAV